MKTWQIVALALVGIYVFQAGRRIQWHALESERAKGKTIGIGLGKQL